MTDKNKQLYLDFEAYERVAEPHKRERASAWRTAIGLQDVDGLKVSDYLKETAVRHIEGDITIDDVREQLKSHYVNKSFLIRFFRNLILGDHHELRNSYMLVGYADVGDTDTSTRTSFDEAVST